MYKTFPILAKELQEIANRKSSYAIRVGYALTFGLLFFIEFQAFTGNAANATDWLGAGRNLFKALAGTQFILILLLVPALVATAITAEKENKTIEVLLTLPVSDRPLLFQKMAGRLVPVLGIILLSSPLLAITTVMGGVSFLDIVQTTFASVLLAIAVASLALSVSASCDTSTRATVYTYIWVAVLGPTCLSPLSFYMSDEAFALFGLFIFVVICMAIAESNFRRRALLKPGQDPNLPPPATQIRNVYVKKFGLPAQNPVRWLEVIKFPLKHHEYAIVVGIIAFIPILGSIGSGESVSFTIGLIILPILVLNLLFRSQQSVRNLKQNQLLPELLATPMRRSSIIKQIVSGRQYGVIQAMICLGLFGFGELVARGIHSSALRHTPLVVPGIALVAPLFLWLHFTLATWIGIVTALLARTGLQALVAGIAYFALITLGTVFTWPMEGLSNQLAVCWHPVTFIYLSIEYTTGRPANNGSAYLAIVLVHFACWTGLLLILRALTLRNADRLLLKT